MRTGIRFTCLKRGDNLLGQTWEYKNVVGVEAIRLKLEDMFWHVSKLDITDVIDTIKLGKSSSNSLYIENSGVNGDLWPFNQRMEDYRKGISKYNLNMVIELEFPTVVTSYNYMQYARYAVEVIDKYSWVKYWQIMTQPESLDATGVQNCPPAVYVQLMKYIYQTIHSKYSDIKIGGPGVLHGIVEYVNSAYTNEDKQLYHTGWLAQATGELYGTSTEYDLTEAAGFLPYIDFFAFQGNESTGEFTFETYQDTINKLKDGINAQMHRNNLSLTFEYYSTEQGHYADKSNYEDMQLQGYRDLREYMNDFAVSVIPFKTQLVDEFYDETDKNTEKNVYGILYYYLGNTRKPSYQQFYFIINKLSNYNHINTDLLMIKNKQPYESNIDVTSVMFINDDKNKIVTVIYPVRERILTANNTYFTKVTLKAGLNRNVYLPDGSELQITSPMDVYFKKYDFVIVEEKLVAGVANTADITKETTARLGFYQKCAKSLLSMVPDDYPKDVFDTNYYKLLRSVAIEYGDAEYERNILEDNMYLSTAHGDAIYNNFGALIGVKWKSTWSEEKYRTIASGLIESLLSGATKNSIAKAIKCYTGYDVHIYEMFTDYEHYGLTQEVNWDNQYRFTIEVEKTIEDSIDIGNLYNDVKSVVDLVKPAHTIPIIMIVMVGEEDYKKWYKERYGVDFNKSDDITIERREFAESNVYGWKEQAYDLILQSTSDGKNSTNTNSAFPIAPKYTLYDRDYIDVLHTEDVKIPKPDMQWLPWWFVKYEDKYNRKTTDVYRIDLEMYESECKYGIKPISTSRTLKTNGGTLYDATGKIIGNEGRITNQYRTGFNYALNDEYWLLIEYFDEEKVHKIVEAQGLIIFENNYEEVYDKDKEDCKIQFEYANEELKYGLVPNYPKTLMTYLKDRKDKRITNDYRYGVRNRLHDDFFMIKWEGNHEEYEIANVYQLNLIEWPNEADNYVFPITESHDYNIAVTNLEQYEIKNVTQDIDVHFDDIEKYVIKPAIDSINIDLPLYTEKYNHVFDTLLSNDIILTIYAQEQYNIKNISTNSNLVLPEFKEQYQIKSADSLIENDLPVYIEKYKRGTDEIVINDDKLLFLGKEKYNVKNIVTNNDIVLPDFKEIKYVVKDTTSTLEHSLPIYDEKYTKTINSVIGMKLFTVDGNGVETIVQESSDL